MKFLVTLVVLAGLLASCASSPVPPEPDFIRSMNVIRSIAIAVEVFATDHDRYPTAEEAQKLFANGHVVALDGWGRSCQYAPAPDKHGYIVISAGADGLFDAKSRSSDPYSAYAKDLGEIPTDDQRADIVLVTGAFIRFPRAAKCWQSPSATPAAPVGLLK